ncbi:hypothetical protein CP500_000050 [Tychonema bourrellyi FEM_GT703]|uniref:Uncharacterized protein n=1 Tax=Tychonema bourrellyi FEM_GT703 TaxID=2040638 RepID=A0A2G4F6H3_9CYAN|nr:hypothetical protein CP500_000050 [Tychonema bourrellyi FEM_GT703]
MTTSFAVEISVSGIGVLVLFQQFDLLRCNVAEVCGWRILKFFSEFRSLSFGKSHSLKLLSLLFYLEDTSASTPPLSNLTQIFPDWWADRTGVSVVALPIITGRATKRVCMEYAEILSALT